MVNTGLLVLTSNFYVLTLKHFKITNHANRKETTCMEFRPVNIVTSTFDKNEIVYGK